MYSLPEGEGGQGLTSGQRRFVHLVQQQGAAAFHTWQEANEIFARIVHEAVDSGVGSGSGSGAALSSGLARFFFEGRDLCGASGRCGVLHSAVAGLHNAMMVLQQALSNMLPLKPPVGAILAGCPTMAGAALDTAELLLRLVAKWARLAQVVRAGAPSGMTGEKLSQNCSVQRLLISARDCLDLLSVAYEKAPLSEAVLPGTAKEQLKRVGSLVATAVKAGRCMPDIPEQVRRGLAG